MTKGIRYNFDKAELQLIIKKLEVYEEYESGKNKDWQIISSITKSYLQNTLNKKTLEKSNSIHLIHGKERLIVLLEITMN